MDNLEQNLVTLQALGLTLPTPIYIFSAVVFGVIGMFAFYRGKKLSLPIVKWLGVALMVYPYFVSETWLMFALGAALCVGLFVYRDGAE